MKVSNDNKPKYGAIIGRFQPFHLGHELIVREIVADGLLPIVIIGSSQESGTERNPFDVNTRFVYIKRTLHSIPTDLIISDLPDCDSWTTWRKQLDKIVGQFNPTFYINCKEQDRMDFTYKKKKYKNTFWTECLKDTYELKQVTFPQKVGVTVNASDIRKDVESNKHFINPIIYKDMKDVIKKEETGSSKE